MSHLYTFEKINDILIVKSRGGRPTKIIKDKKTYTRKNKHKTTKSTLLQKD